MWSLMASAPALLLGVLGIVGRTQITTWEFEAYTRQQNSEILAYREPVIQACTLKIHREHSPEGLDLLIKVTENWLRLRAAGALKDVLPGSMDDQGSDGTKLQILEARQILLNQTNHLAFEQRSSGDLAGSAKSVARSIALADIFKYSGISALQQSSLAQASGMRSLMHAAPMLSKADLAEVASYVRLAYRADEPVLPLAEEISHLSIKRRMKQGKSLTDMNSVFLVAHLDQLEQGPNRKTSSQNASTLTCGLEVPMANTMMAALRTEARVQAVMAEFLRTYGSS